MRKTSHPPWILSPKKKTNFSYKWILAFLVSLESSRFSEQACAKISFVEAPEGIQNRVER